ncbi:MAG: OadG family protein [Bacteroidetes bacterium]|nr:OadG family protein [Bacteroidota bacterium]
MQETLVQTPAVVDSLARNIVDTLAQGSPAAGWKYTGIESIMQGDGIMISIVGIIIVFSALTIITLLIRALKVLLNPKQKKTETAEERPATNGVSGEIVAAIALALQTHLFELHDEERTIITIKKISRPYSPWSSKLYGMTPSPNNQITKR